MIISIRNWDKYNPKRDQKTYAWLRLNNDTFSGQDFCEYSASELIVWISILCEASKKNQAEVDLKLPYLKIITRLNEKDINDTILKLHNDNFLEIKADVVIRPRTTPTRQIATPTYERTNERTNDIVDSSIDESSIYTDSQNHEQLSNVKCNAKLFKADMELLYAEYPKKEGKKKGLERFNKIIKTQETYDNVLTAIRNYSNQCKETEKQYIKQFSSFSSVWEDYLVVDESLSENEEIIAKLDARPFNNFLDEARENGQL